jgi:hypothetical protein
VGKAIIERQDDSRLDIWQQPLEIKEPLPKIPLWLKGGLCLSIDREEPYHQTCRGLRIDTA